MNEKKSKSERPAKQPPPEVASFRSAIESLLRGLQVHLQVAKKAQESIVESLSIVKAEAKTLNDLVRGHSGDIANVRQDLEKHEQLEEKQLAEMVERFMDMKQALHNLADSVQVFNRQMERRILDKLEHKMDETKMKIEETMKALGSGGTTP